MTKPCLSRQFCLRTISLLVLCLSLAGSVGCTHRPGQDYVTIDEFFDRSRRQGPDDILFGRPSHKFGGDRDYKLQTAADIAKLNGVDYWQTLEQAINGNQAAVGRLMKLCNNMAMDRQADHAHGELVGALLRWYGDDAFAAMVLAQPVPVREAVGKDLRWNFEVYAPGRANQFAKIYPNTEQACFGHQQRPTTQH